MATAPITVVIPVFNRSHLLGRALQSVANQLLPPERIVVVDDGSIDDSAEVARAFGATVLVQQNKGASSARNAAIEMADTPWIAFLDSDDEWRPDHLSTVVPQLGGFVLVGSAAMTNEGRLRGSLRKHRVVLVAKDQLIWPENPIVTSSAVVRSDAVKEAGGFNSRLTYNEDLDLWLRLLDRGPGAVLPNVTVSYRVHSAQLTNDGDSMHSQTMSMLDGAVSSGWISNTTLRRVQAREHWDAYRADASGWGTKREHLRFLASPSNAAALANLLVIRARARRIAASHVRANGERKAETR